jgi:uncharacterized membrane protein
MSLPKHTWPEQQIEKIVGNLLRVGVILAAVVVFGGGALYLIRAEATSPDHRVFHGEPADLRSVSGIVTDALALQSRGIIQLGLLLLVATPVARVAFSAFAFAQHAISPPSLSL